MQDAVANTEEPMRISMISRRPAVVARRVLIDVTLAQLG
jgi:hypothetical protein